jgi:hypothetical protein
MRLTTRDSDGIASAIQEGREFTTRGSLSGQPSTGWTGRLPSEWQTEYRDREDRIAYTVYSYGTPIAWLDTEEGWVMPDVKYSVTTSKQQGTIRMALYYLDVEDPRTTLKTPSPVL